MTRSILLSLALAAPAQAELSWEPSLAKALQAAGKSSSRVLIDFTAPWCYSCYYMDQKVLTRPGFAEASKGLVLSRVDVDQPEGRKLKAQHRVSFLPSFVVLDAKGRELGRILGEQREEDFLAQLKAILDGGKRTPEDEAVAKLEGFLRRKELGRAAAFAAGPSPASKRSLADRADWRRLELRVQLKTKPTPEALKAMVALNDGCDLAYDVFDGLKAKPAKASVEGLRARLEAWAGQRLWVPRASRCADFRSGVDALAEFYEAIDDLAAKAAVLDRAATLIAAESDAAGLGADRNLDDDRRYLLDAAKRDRELEELFPKLAAAYPSDYVYAQRFAKWLAGKMRWAEALEWSEKASRLCYGANRLSVTKLQAEILSELGRLEDARALLKRDIKANAKALPDDVKPLEELLASLAKGAR